MRSLLARLAVLGAFAISIAGCGAGASTSLPFAGPPNNGGGTAGQFQSGGTGSALLRFVQGSPDVATVDFCIDNISIGGANGTSGSTQIPYKGFTPSPIAVSAGISHTVAVYPTTGPFTSGGNGVECPTAPGPYLGTSALAVTTFTLAANTRSFIVLGGRTGSTLGFYFFPSPTTFVNPPTSPEALVFNASPTFGKAGFGYTLAGGAAANLLPSVNAPEKAKTTSTPTAPGSFGLAPMAGQPATFYVGLPVTSGTVVPLVSEPAAPQITGNTYVADVFSVDSTNAAGVDIVSIPETTIGFGF